MRDAAHQGAPFQQIYRMLDDAHGPQYWWPGDTPFEVMVGAILTQNTAWTNVERAVHNLQRSGLLTPQAIIEVERGQLAQQVRPSGYFNVKSERLVNFCEWLLAQGGESTLSKWPTDKLRNGLLGIKGIGPETADDILLYAFHRPVFVIDAYTRRIFSRLGLLEAKAGYESLRHRFESALGHDAALFNQYHALIVRHAKVACRPKPACAECALAQRCPWPGSRKAG